MDTKYNNVGVVYVVWIQSGNSWSHEVNVKGFYEPSSQMNFTMRKLNKSKLEVHLYDIKI